MSFGLWSLVFLLLVLAVGYVRFSHENATSRTGLVLDAAFVAMVACFLACVIGHFGRRLAMLIRADDGHADDGPAGSGHEDRPAGWDRTGARKTQDLTAPRR